MRNLFVIVGLSAAALTAACGSPSPGKSGKSDGAIPGSGAAEAGVDAPYAPDSRDDLRRGGASPADVSSTGGATGGTTATATGGAGGSGTPAPTGGVSGSDGPTATGGPGVTDGPKATGGVDAREVPLATGGTGAGGIAGSTATAGRAAAGGATASAGSTAGTSAGATAAGGTTPTGGTTAAGGTIGTGGAAGTTTAADNVAEVSVDFGLPNIGYINGLFATVTVCVPGTSQCQSIDHVLVDTGSSGLRLLGSVLTLSLPAWTNNGGVALAECGQFVGGFMWGPLRSADVRIAGERANGLAIQVIDESTYPVPSTCTGFDASSAETLRANGILGVSPSLQDCGPACAAALGRRSTNPGVYYACTSASGGGCQAAAVPVSKQLSNPVAFFSQDNNGSIIELPAISADGAPSVTGSLIFGIGTRDNNGLGQATMIPLDDTGSFVTSYPTSSSNLLAFVDSGSNAISFPNSGTTRIPTCSNPYSDFYCPRSTLSLSATNQDASGSVIVTVNFSIANAVALFANPDNVAFDNLGALSTAPQSGTTGIPAYFDWGLPFHFGRNVFTAIEGQSTPAGVGPFVAF